MLTSAEVDWVPPTPTPRRAGCEAHKSGSVRAGGGQLPPATRHAAEHRVKIHNAMGERLQSNQGKRRDARSTTTSPSHCSGRSSTNRNGSRIQLSPCMCDRILSRLFVTSACANHRTISDTQPGRERPRDRPWGQGRGSGGGVAHVPAASPRCCWAAAKTAAASLSIRAVHCPQTLTAYSVARTSLAPPIRTIPWTCGPVLP